MPLPEVLRLPEVLVEEGSKLVGEACPVCLETYRVGDTVSTIIHVVCYGGRSTTHRRALSLGVPLVTCCARIGWTSTWKSVTKLVACVIDKFSLWQRFLHRSGDVVLHAAAGPLFAVFLLYLYGRRCIVVLLVLVRQTMTEG